MYLRQEGGQFLQVQISAIISIQAVAQGSAGQQGVSNEVALAGLVMAQLLALNRCYSPGSELLCIVPESVCIGVDMRRGEPPPGIEYLDNPVVGCQQYLLAAAIELQHPGTRAQLVDFCCANRCASS